MQVGKILPHQAFSSISKNISSPIRKVSNQPVQNLVLTTGLSMGAISGAYIAQRTKQKSSNIALLRDLKLSDETINKVLSVKRDDGSSVFDKNGIEILSETSKLEDSTFFTFVMKNIEHVKDFTKRDSNSGLVYEVSIKSPTSTQNAEMILKEKLVTINFMKNKKDLQIYENYLNSEKTINNAIKVYKKDAYGKDNLILNKIEIFDKERNTYTVKKDYNTYWTAKTLNLAKEGIIESIDNISFNKINKSVKINSKDYANNTVLDAKSNKNTDEMYIQTKTYTNPLTKQTLTSKMQLSDVPGVYNSIITDDKGNTRIESYGKKNLDGSVVVEKNYESLDGTKTQYSYKASQNKKDIKTHYVITDSKGNVLMTQDRTFKRISPTKAISSINGHEYFIEQKDSILSVTDRLNGETTNMRHDMLYANLSSRAFPEMISQLSGDMLLDFFNRQYTYAYNDDIMSSHTNAKDKILSTKSDLYVFAHEQGHTKDLFFDYGKRKLGYTLTENPEFKEQFQQERETFIKAFPKFEQKYIDYFIEQIGRTYQDGACEALAETNAILSNSTGNNTFAARNYYLQKYFPKTIAVLARLLNTNSNLYVGK